MTKIDLDRFDYALLDEVRRNNLTPARILAGRIGLSESAVLRRLRRLRSEHVISGDVSIVQPEILGRPLTVLVLVHLVREGRKQIDQFASGLTQRPEVTDVWYVTGEADFVAVVQVSDMASYEEFTQEVFLADANVSSFTTMVSMRHFAPSESGRQGRH